MTMNSHFTLPDRAARFPYLGSGSNLRPSGGMKLAWLWPISHDLNAKPTVFPNFDLTPHLR